MSLKHILFFLILIGLNLSCIKREDPLIELRDNGDICKDLPFDLGTYNILKTKSAQSYHTGFNVEQFLLWNDEKSITDGDSLVIRQIPVNLAEDTKYASVFNKIGYIKDSCVVKFRSYLMILENMKTGHVKNMVVTMIPFTSNEQEISNFDYISKKGFNGIVIYSNKKGKYLSNRIYLRDSVYYGQMLKASELSSFKENKYYINFYKKLLTKSGENNENDWEMELDEVVVTGSKKKGGSVYIPDWTSDFDVDTDSNNDGRDDNTGGGGVEPPQPNFYTVDLTTDGGGIVNGDGTYESGEMATIYATPHEGYVFGGWSGSVNTKSPSYTFEITGNMSMKAVFYLATSECGKLAKSIDNYDQLIKYRNKIQGLTEYGYMLTDKGLIEGIGTSGKLRYNYKGEKIKEMVHTHDCPIHPSIADLTNILTLLRNGHILDYSEYKYTIVSPDYFVVFKIADVQKMLSVDFSVMNELYIKNVPVIPNSVEGYFLNFLSFFENANLGLNLFVHKTVDGIERSVQIKSKTDFQNLINNITICNN